jgi:pyruvate/2-oxoglutarate dehydrogenase complex dihydrolipoamide acyltransferase (E2) component
MSGSCFTISSLGGIGGTYFAPIVNAPEVAILGVNKSAMKPVWDGKQFVPRLTLPLSLTADHRVIDGALATRFNVYVAQLLADMRRMIACKGNDHEQLIEVKVPDIGDFAEVPIIDLFVKVGDSIKVDDAICHAGIGQGDHGCAEHRCRRGQGSAGSARRQGRRRSHC